MSLLQIRTQQIRIETTEWAKYAHLAETRREYLLELQNSRWISTGHPQNLLRNWYGNPTRECCLLKSSCSICVPSESSCHQSMILSASAPKPLPNQQGEYILFSRKGLRWNTSAGPIPCRTATRTADLSRTGSPVRDRTCQLSGPVGQAPKFY